MGLRSVSASEDVIGDPSRPGTNNSELLEPRREEREKVLGEQASFRFKSRPVSVLYYNLHTLLFTTIVLKG